MIKSLKNRKRLDAKREAARQAWEVRALDVGVPIDLAKELRRLNRELRKEGKPTIHLSKYGLLPEVERDAMSSLGLSPDPREWNHNSESTKFFNPLKCKPMPERSGREAG